MDPIINLSAPSHLMEQYQLILATMCVLQYESAGDLTEVNCPAIVRAVAREFPEFTAVDGYVPQLVHAGHEDASFGQEVLFRFESGLRAFTGKFNILHHSWLSWKEDEKFILDVCPVGGVPGASAPVLLHQDGHSIIYEKKSLPAGVSEELLAPDVEKFHARFKKTQEGLFPINNHLLQAAQKTP